MSLDRMALAVLLLAGSALLARLLRPAFGARLAGTARPKQTWTELGFVTLLLFLLASLASGELVGWLSGESLDTPTSGTLRWSLAVTNALNLSIIAAVLALGRRRGVSAADAGLARPRGVAPFLFAALSLVAFAPAYLAASLINDRIVSSLDLQPRQVYVELLLDDAQLRGDPAVLFAIVVLVPLCEEILFRGFLLRAARCVLGPAAAIVATSILFALVHDIQSALPVFAIAVCLGFVAESTGSVLPSAFAHALFNGGMLIYISRYPA